MELLLNLIWVLLALPAFWLWSRQDAADRKGQYFSRAHVLMVLAFVLLLLFPFVSATDDVRAMQPETEESGTGRRVCKSGEDSRERFSSAGVQPLAMVGPVRIAPVREFAGRVLAATVSHLTTILLSPNPGRAPPASNLA